jgi:AcrR family transcriptional regulator
VAGVGLPVSKRGVGGALPDRALRRRGRLALERLFTAAEEVFARQGYHDARIEDIVTRSGMARTTFYDYFGGKEDLLRAVVADVADELRTHAAALPPLRRGAQGRTALRQWFGEYVEIWARHAELLRIWVEAEVTGTDLGALAADVFGEVERRFSDALRAGAVGRGPAAAADIDVDVASLALVAMIERVPYYGAVGFLAASADEIADALTGIVHDALFTRT